MTKNKIIILLSILVSILFVSLLYLLSLRNQKPKTTYNGVLPLSTVSQKKNWKVEFSAYNVSFMIPDGWGINNDAMDGNFIQINSDKVISEGFNLIWISKTPGSESYIQIDLTDPLSDLKKMGFEPEFEDIISSMVIVNDWLTTTDKKLGIEISYPKTWWYEDGRLFAESCKLYPECLVIGINKVEYDLNKFIADRRIDDGAVDNTDIVPKKIKIGNIDATELTYGNAMGLGSRDIFISINNKNYLLSHLLSDANSKDPEIVQILSTFKFINP